MKKTFLLCLTWVCCLTGSLADTLAEVDSLLQVYEKSKGEKRTDVGQELMTIYTDFPVFFNESLTIDESMNAKERDFIVWYSTERFYTSCAYYSEALRYNDMALTFTESIQMPESPGSAPTLHQNLYATLLCDRVYCLFKTSDYMQAIEQSERAIGVCQQTGNKLQLARAYLYISLVNHALQNHEEAIQQVESAIRLNEQIGDKSQLHNTLGIACEIFCSARQPDKAVGYGLRAVEVAREMNFQSGVANHLMQLSYAYDRKGDYQQGINAADEAIAIIKQVEPLDRNQLALSLEYKSWNLIDIGRHREAAEALREAIRLETEVGNTHAAWNNYRTLSEALEPYDLKGAVDALRLYTRMGDSIHSQQLRELMSQANAGFHNDELREENEQSRRMNRIITWTAVVVVLMLFAVIASLWFAFRQKKRSNQTLQRLTEVREAFFTNVTHELRTPLTVILGLGEELSRLQSPEVPASVTEAGQAIERQGRQLLTLVNQMLDISKVKSSLGEQPRTEGNVAQYVAMVVEHYQEMARQKGVAVNYTADEGGIETSYVADYVEKLVGNLMSNAIKFTPQGGNVDVELHRHDNSLLLTVSDNGKGIAPEYLPHIFEPFFNVGSAEGTGVGLALVKQIVDELKGDIKVESKEGEGSKFRVSLPIMPTSQPSSPTPTAEDKDRPEDIPVNNDDHTSNPAEGEGGTPTLLIVEDNTDVAALIERQLHGRYNISFAADGQQGLKKARKLMPDLIITDLMMPHTDGLQLCREIRADEVTNHIPIIVVTAKATDADRLRGLQAGADAYLNKPFNAEELRVRVEKLLEMRTLLQQKFSAAQAPAVAPEERVADKKEEAAERTSFVNPSEQFVNRVKQTVLELIDTKQCDVEHVAAKLFMSPFQLRSKLSAVIGVTPKKFILKLQLEHACQMIKEHPNRLITDVAERCGFYDKSHFTRHFRDAFGMTPGEYAQQCAAQNEEG